MQTSQPKLQKLSLENFTAFEKAEFNFCQGINVIIGANATGKSHMMKLAYTLLKVCKESHSSQATQEHDLEVAMFDILPQIFRLDSISDLVRRGKPEAVGSFDYNDKGFAFGINYEAEDIYLSYKPKDLPVPSSQIYLPAQEFLSINEGFIAAYNKRELPYDETYYDLSLALNALPLRKDKLTDVQEIISFLRKIIAGDEYEKSEVVMQENGRFKFSLPEGRLDAHLVAEGYRKIATLLYLLQNGSLTKDSVLFWDEPEANLNPKLVVQLVKVLQMLAAVGVQIFVATHDYLLSHELSLLADYPSHKNVEIKFFALYKPDRQAGVLVEAGQTLADIENNPILEEFAAHYDRESSLFYQSETVAE